MRKAKKKRKNKKKVVSIRYLFKSIPSQSSPFRILQVLKNLWENHAFRISCLVQHILQIKISSEEGHRFVVDYHTKHHQCSPSFIFVLPTSSCPVLPSLSPTVTPKLVVSGRDSSRLGRTAADGSFVKMTNSVGRASNIPVNVGSFIYTLLDVPPFTVAISFSPS